MTRHGREMERAGSGDYLQVEQEEGLLHGGAEQHNHDQQVDPSPGKDRAAAACYFLLGAGMLAPWNAYITATDYFSAVYGSHMDRIFTLCYLPTCLALLLVMVYLGPRWASLHTRITVGFTGFVSVTVLMPLVDAAMVRGGSAAPTAALGIVLAAVLVTGVLDGVSQGAVFVDAAQAGQRYTHAVVGGTACSGVIICLLRLVTKAAFPGGTIQGLRESTAVYFAAAAVLAAAGLAVHLLALPRLGVRLSCNALHENGASMGDTHVHACMVELAGISNKAAEAEPEADGQLQQQPLQQQQQQQHSRNAGSLQGQSNGHADEEEEEEDEEELHVSSALLFGRQRYTPLQDGALRSPTSSRRSSASSRSWPWASSAAAVRQRRQGITAVTAEGQGRELRYVRVMCVAKRCWPSLACLFVTYVATLSVFPGVLAEDIHSDSLGDWLPLLLITLFNAADAAGKLAPIRAATWLQRQHWLFAASMLRLLLLLPALVGAAAASAPLAAIAALTAIFGLTNGYLTALAMTLGPAFVVTTKTHDQAGQGFLPASSHSPLRDACVHQRLPSPTPPWHDVLTSRAQDWLQYGLEATGVVRLPGGTSGTEAASHSQYISLGALGRSDSGGGLLPTPRFSHASALGDKANPHADGSTHSDEPLPVLYVPKAGRVPPRSPLGNMALASHMHLGAQASLASPPSYTRATDSPSTHIPANSGWHPASAASKQLPQADADLAEDLCVVSLVSGLMVGALTGWLWLLLPHAA